MNPPLERAQLLMEQNRFEQAARELTEALRADPDNPLVHAMMASCLSAMERQPDALAAAERAIALAPEYDDAHYIRGHILLEMRRYREAEQSVREALRLDFYDANYHALLAAVFQAQSQWRKMLEAAETGLQVDPEHVGSANLRAFALNRLNRKDEASAALETALARDPENATTHASQGWTRLHQGDTQGALHHFREALRLEPDHAWAREGIIEALKSRHFMYRLFLRYLFWMARLSPSAQWGVVMGLFIGSRLVRSLGQSIPELAPFLKPISLLYILFVFFTWTARPLFNLLLRLDKFGRLVLTPSQIVATNWIGACLLTALVSGALCFVFPEPVWFALLITSLGMVIPIAGTFRGRFDEPTLGMGLFAGVLGLLAVFTVAGAAVAGAEGASLPGGLFGVGVFAFMIASNFARGR